MRHDGLSCGVIQQATVDHPIDSVGDHRWCIWNPRSEVMKDVGMVSGRKRFGRFCPPHATPPPPKAPKMHFVLRFSTSPTPFINHTISGTDYYNCYGITIVADVFGF